MFVTRWQNIFLYNNDYAKNHTTATIQLITKYRSVCATIEQQYNREESNKERGSVVGVN